MDRKILLFLKLLLTCSISLVLLTESAYSQQVSGTVIDSETGEQLPGVSVVVDGTTTGTTTNASGEYELSVSSMDVTLVFSFIGYQTQRISVDGRSTIDVELVSRVIVGDEMVVTAFGIEREAKALTFSTQDVNVERISQARELNVATSLQGKIAGMSVTQSTSGLGADARVVLRGDRSIQGDSQPLYVLDGVPIRGNINDLNPDDIASINVLKGPNAAALYGSAAQNGAIIITTKRGVSGQVQVSMSNTFMVSEPIFAIEYQNEFGQGSGGAYQRTADGSWGPRMEGQMVETYSPDPSRAGETYAFNPQPDNISDIFQRGYNNASNLSAMIGGETTQSAFSYTFTDAQGILPGNTLDRHNVSLRITSQLTDRFRLDGRLAYARTMIDNVQPTGESLINPYRQIYRVPRNISTAQLRDYEWVDEQGNIRHNYFNVGASGTGVNPYWNLNNMTNQHTRERVIAMTSLSYEIAENLSLMVRGAYDGGQDRVEEFVSNESFGSLMLGRYLERRGEALELNTDFLLSYTERISDDWDISANVGGNYKQQRNTWLQAHTGDGLIVPNFFSLGNTSRTDVSRSIGSPMDIASLYAFGEIAWRNSIFLDISGRNDWSSTLPSDNRSYFYPSVGLSVVFSDLFSDFPEFFTFARVRGSWSTVGNSAPPFMLNRAANFTSGGQSGFIQLNPTLPNERLVPEETEAFELGMDLRFFGGRLNMDFTAYRTNTRNQLFTVALPVGSGANQFFTNGGDVENKGFEAVLNLRPVQRPNFSWEIDTNFSMNRNKVLRIDDERPVLTLTTDFLRAFRIEEGRPFGEVYSRGFLRDDAGNVVVAPSGVPRVTPGQNVRVANFNPDWLGGITNTFNYRNLSLSIQIDHRQGGSITSITNAIIDADGVTKRTLQGRDGTLVFGENIFANETAVKDDGSPNDIQIDSESFWRGIGGRNVPVGEAFVEDATNTRVRELAIGYSLPQSILEGVPSISNVRFSVVGRNLFFIYRKSDRLDPDHMPGTGPAVEGFDSFGPPTSRSYGFNVNIDF